MKERALVTVVFDRESDLWSKDKYENMILVHSVVLWLQRKINDRGYFLYPELFTVLGYNIDGGRWYDRFNNFGWAYKLEEGEKIELRYFMEDDDHPAIEVLVKKEEE